MKTKSFLAVTFLFLSNISFPQQSKVNYSVKNFLSLSFTHGINVPLDNSGTYKAAGTGQANTFEFSYVFGKHVGFYGSLSITDFNTDQFQIYSESIRNYEWAAGIRLYTGNRKFFLNVGAGYYDIKLLRDNLEPSFESRLTSTQELGLNIGLGTRIILSGSYGILLNGKLNLASHSFAGINAGLELNNSKDLPVRKSNRKISSSLLAGTAKINDNKPSASYGAEITYDVSEKLSLVGNYLHRNSTEKSYESDKLISENDFAGGIRLYVGEERLKFFVESLLDLNTHKETFESLYYDYTVNSNSLGIVMGAGIEFSLLNNFSGLLKGNMFKFDRPGTTTGLYGGVKYQF